MRTLLAAFFIPLAAQCQAGSLCSAQESTVFSCNARAKTISVCASKSMDKNDAYIHYLYKDAKRITLDFPPKKQYDNHTFRGYYAYGPGFQSYLTFANGQFRYYVYSNYGDDSYSTTGQKMSIAFDESGVVVLKGLHKVAHVKCSNSFTQLSEAVFKDYMIPSDEADKFQEAFFNAWSE
jgi:hypothetical protein